MIHWIQKNTFAIIAAAVVLILGAVIANIYLGDMPWVSMSLLGSAVIVLIALLVAFMKGLNKRTALHGSYSVASVLLVLVILGFINYFAKVYTQKWDTTKNKLYTFSEQTTKIAQQISKPLLLTFYGRADDKERFKPLVSNYTDANTKIQVEWVDPNREPTRAKQAGIKRLPTLQIVYGDKTTLLEDFTNENFEEKLTNALIKSLSEKKRTFCAISGHGEKPLASNEAEGYQSVKQGLENQSYEVKDVLLAQSDKIPPECDAVGIFGPTKGFFPQEIKVLETYLTGGGRAVIALDINLRGGEYNPELSGLLKTWYVDVQNSLVVDPLSRLLGADASIPVIPTFSSDHPITKDLANLGQGAANAFFPFMRPVEALANVPADLKVTWLGKTTPKSWAETNLKQLATGQAGFDSGSDRQGPVSAAVAVEGKLQGSTASRPTRIVVFGTSHFATNNFQRNGFNGDLMLNAISWSLEDESLISIRAKEDDPGKIDISNESLSMIALLAKVVFPLLLMASGIAVWVIRRKL